MIHVGKAKIAKKGSAEASAQKVLKNINNLLSVDIKDNAKKIHFVS